MNNMRINEYIRRLSTQLDDEGILNQIKNILYRTNRHEDFISLLKRYRIYNFLSDKDIQVVAEKSLDKMGPEKLLEYISSEELLNIYKSFSLRLIDKKTINLNGSRNYSLIDKVLNLKDKENFISFDKGDYRENLSINQFTNKTINHNSEDHIDERIPLSEMLRMSSFRFFLVERIISARDLPNYISDKVSYISEVSLVDRNSLSRYASYNRIIFAEPLYLNISSIYEDYDKDQEYQEEIEMDMNVSDGYYLGLNSLVDRFVAISEFEFEDYENDDELMSMVIEYVNSNRIL